MIEIPIDNNYTNRAREKASTVGILQGSITGGTSNVVGAIGEIIVADSIEAEQMNTYDYDLVKDGMRIDVKTKRCNCYTFKADCYNLQISQLSPCHEIKN